MKEIQPTHSCFDDAIELIADFVKKNHAMARDQETRLVHALCQAPTGELFAHAWVEIGDADRENGRLVVFSGIEDGEFHYFITPASDYYATFRVRQTTKYSVAEAGRMNFKHGTYGPWEQRYIEACSDQRRIFGVTIPDEPTDQTGKAEHGNQN